MATYDELIRLLLDLSSTIDETLDFIERYPTLLSCSDGNGNLPIHIECMNQCRPEIIQMCVVLYPGSLIVPNISEYLPLHEILSVQSSSLDIALMMINQMKYTVEHDALNGNLPLHIECATNARHEVIAACIQLYPLGLSQSNLMENRPLNKLLQNDLNASESALLMMTACPDAVKHKNSDGDLPIHTECSMLCRYDVMLKAIELYPESLAIRNLTGRSPLLLLLQNRRASVSTVRLVIDKYVGSLNLKQINTSDLPLTNDYLCSDVHCYLSTCTQICPKSVAVALSLGYLRLDQFLDVSCLPEDSLSEIVELYPNVLKLSNASDENLIHIECRKERRDFMLSTFVSLSPESLSMANRYGDLPLHVLLCTQSDSGSKFLANLSLVDMMIDAHEKALLSPSKSMNLPIHVECMNGCRYDLLLDMITRYPEELSVANSSGYLPLHSLLMNTNSSVTSALLLLDAYPQVVREKSIVGNYPLHIECNQQCRWEIIAQLIELWPEALYEANQDGLLPLHLMLKNQSSVDVICLVINKCKSAIFRQDCNAELLFNYEVNTRFRLEVISKLVQLSPPYLDALLSQDTALWPKLLTNLNPTNCRSFYPILCKWMAAYPERYKSLLSEANLVDDACCGRMILNYHPSALRDYPVLLEKYRDYNWHSRSNLIPLLSKIRSNYHKNPSAASTFASSLLGVRYWIVSIWINNLPVEPDGSNNLQDKIKSSASTGLVILAKIIEISSCCDPEGKHATLPLCNSNQIGDCLLRSVIGYL
jgi:ankyrin repeat protein